MGLAPAEWPSAFSLYHQKLGDLPAADDSLSLRVGRHFESLVCELFAERYPGLDVYGDGRRSTRTQAVRGSGPRRTGCCTRAPGTPAPAALPCDVVCTCIVPEPVAVLEAKTSAAYDGWGDDGSDEIPVHYRCQALWQMDVMGVAAASVACLFLHSRQLRVYDISLDANAETDLKLMREEAEMFWSRLARHDEPGGRLASRHHRRAQDPSSRTWSSGTSPWARRWPGPTAPPSAATRTPSGART